MHQLGETDKNGIMTHLSAKSFLSRECLAENGLFGYHAIFVRLLIFPEKRLRSEETEEKRSL